MDSAGQCSFDSTVDSEASVDEVLVENYEEYNAQVLDSSQNDEDQGGEQQVLAYIEMESSDPTSLILQPHVIYTPGDESSHVMLVVSSEQAQTELEQSFAESSDDHPDVISLDTNLENAIVVEDMAQNIELLETEEIPQVHEETIFSEKNGIDDPCSSSANVNETTWTVENNEHERESVVLIPASSTVASSSLAPEETRHRKLMQLAYIAHELQHADQKNSSGALTEPVKNTTYSFNIPEGSVIVTQQNMEESTDNTLLLSADDDGIKITEAGEEALSEEKTENETEVSATVNVESDVLNSNSISSFPCYEAARTVDNTVSVIHATTSVAEVQSTLAEVDVEKTAEKDESSYILSKDSTGIENESSNLQLLLNERNKLLKENETDINASKNMALDLTYKEAQVDCCPHTDFGESSLQENNDNFDCLERKLAYDHTNQCNQIIERMGDDTCNSAESSSRNSSIIIVEDDQSKGEEFMNNNLSASNEDCVPVEVNDTTNISVKITCKDHLEQSDADTNEKQIPAKISNNLDVTNNDVTYSSENLHKADEYEFSDTERCDSNIDSSVKNTVFFSEQPALLPASVEMKTRKKYAPSCKILLETNGVTNDMEGFNDAPVVNLEQETSSMETSKHQDSSVNTMCNASQDLVFHSSQDEDDVEVDKTLDPTVSENYLVPGIVCVEETFVEPPKKTYVRKKKSTSENKSNLDKENIELFSCEELTSTDCDNNDHETVVENDLQQQASIEAQGDGHLDDEDLILCAVSATYGSGRKKAKIVPPVVREIRTRSLRPRSSNSKSSSESFPEELLNDNSQSDGDHWGDILMNASFRSEEASNDPSPPLASTPKKKVSWPVSSRKRGRPPKSNVKDRLEWEKLIKSSPSKLKFHDDRLAVRKRVIKQAMSRLNSSSFSGLPSNLSRFQRKRGRPRKSDSNIPRKSDSNIPRKSYSNISRLNTSNSIKSYRGLKKADIRILPETENRKNEIICLSPYEPRSEFNCVNCSFVTRRINNLLTHAKYCQNKTPLSMIAYRVDDMERRQRIRGEDLNDYCRIMDKRRPAYAINGSLADIRDTVQECSEDSFASDSEDDLAICLKSRRKFGFGENDVVWTKVEDRFWPGLVCNLTKRKACVMLINSAMEKKAVKTKVEHLHSYDDAKWNKMLLAEAEGLPFYDSFVKAVQKSETFVRKKLLGNINEGKKYFGFPEEVEFISDDDSSVEYCIDDEDDTSTSSSSVHSSSSNYDRINHVRVPDPDILPERNRTINYDDLDVPQLMQCILEGHCTDHILAVYHGEIKSKRHDRYFYSRKKRNRLQSMTWFGPIRDGDTQNQLFEYLEDMYKEQVGSEWYSSSYVCEVWLPEAIVKSISLVKNISLEEAEDMFDDSERDYLEIKRLRREWK